MQNDKLRINGAVVEYIKLEDSIEFFCARCGKRKVSKKFGQYQEDGTPKKLCNGCYGRLLSMKS